MAFMKDCSTTLVLVLILGLCVLETQSLQNNNGIAFSSPFTTISNVYGPSVFGYVNGAIRGYFCSDDQCKTMNSVDIVKQSNILGFDVSGPVTQSQSSIYYFIVYSYITEASHTYPNNRTYLNIRGCYDQLCTESHDSTYLCNDTNMWPHGSICAGTNVALFNLGSELTYDKNPVVGILFFFCLLLCFFVFFFWFFCFP